MLDVAKKRRTSEPGSSQFLTRLSQEIKGPGFGDGLHAPLHAQFATNVKDVFLDRVHAEHQALSDLAV